MKKTERSANATTGKRLLRGGAARARSQTFLSTMKGAGSRALNIKHFCDTYRVTLETFARLTGFSLRAVAHWAHGGKPSEATERRLTELKRIFDALEKLVSPGAIGPWLKEPNVAFDGSTPLQVIERGETDRIWRMIYEIESGDTRINAA